MKDSPIVKLENIHIQVTSQVVPAYICMYVCMYMYVSKHVHVYITTRRKEAIVLRKSK